MPTYRKPRKYVRKKSKTYKRKRKPAQLSTAVARIGYSSGLRMFPPKFMAKLKYTTQLTLLPGTTDTWSNSVYYSMTNPLDPNPLAGGTSASHFAQMAAIYNQYRVIKSVVNVSGVMESGNTMLVACSQTDDTTSVELTGVNQRVTDQQTNYRMVDNDHSKFSITQYYNAKKLHGNDDGQAAHVTANPTENTYCLIGSANLRGGVAQSIISSLVQITYTVLFSEIKEDNHLI